MEMPQEHFDYHSTTRLAELGLQEGSLRNAVEWAISHLSYCTSLEPPQGPGMIVWSKAVRALREALLPSGWTPDNRNGYPTVVSPDGRLAIAVATGSSRTGQSGTPFPTTKNPKGVLTEKAVIANVAGFRQLSLEDSDAETAEEPIGVEARQTWVLLFDFDELVDLISLELSMPKAIDKSGFITSWSERILLKPIAFALGASQADDEDDEGEETDIDVQWRGNPEQE